VRRPPPTLRRHAQLFVAVTLSVMASACDGVIESVGSPATDCPACVNGGPDAATAPGGSPGGAGPGGVGGPGETPPGGEDAPAGIGDPNTPDGVGYSTRFPKLSNAQWERSVTDLLRLDQPLDLSQEFTQEALDKGYETVAAATLTISGDAWARYQTAAERAAELVSADAAKLAKITPPGSFANDTERGAAFIDAFGRRAYRRPLSSAEKSAFRALFARGPELVGGSAFPAGARLVIEAMLQSANFLYRVEQATSSSAREPKAWLSGYELATRLAYAFTGSTPSDELLDAAQAGQLDDADGVASWAERLLGTPRARELLLAFHEQTFAVASYGTQTKDATLGFDADALAPLLREEARQFFGLVIDGGGGIEQLLTEPVAFVNQDTARFYGLSGITGSNLRRQQLPSDERAGLLTQLGFLSKNATRNASDPVHRGLTVLRKVLCDEPDPPPTMFDLPKAEAGLTTREVYEKATACGVGCHDTLINPPGFAFEIFDGVGALRSSEQGKPIDASGSLTLRSGFTTAEKRANPTMQVTFDGPVELMQKLAATPRVHECYARNFMSYVLAREVDPVERGASEVLGQHSHEAASMRELLLALVKLDTFRARVDVAQ
jgi:Protein of unknown function (DUF1592)/Protein of unknown function (DUF1588)/Protein of unknown function (DUF1595)/Protein of unknown function (DUF1587)/Protein of unknown function (DUF1585)